MFLEEPQQAFRSPRFRDTLAPASVVTASNRIKKDLGPLSNQSATAILSGVDKAPRRAMSPKIEAMH